jgi:hypothetical protein
MATNVLQTVQTYNDSNLALLLNSYAFIGTANMKFKDFDRVEKNLGDSITFDLPPRFTTSNTLVASFQGADQRAATLTVDQAANVAYEFSAQEFIFNVRDYMDKFGKSAMAELGTKMESNVAGVAETSPFRFYGDGVTAISSYGQLANALAYFRDFGAAKEDTKGYLDNLTVPGVVNTGLNQFVPQKNEREMMSWELGSFSRCDWYESNLLPVHTAGTEGQQGSTLTVVSTTKNAAGAITDITFSGTNAASDADSVKLYDSFQFSDGVSGHDNMRFLTFIGHNVSQSPVQFRATANAASTGGSQVTVSVYPPLQPTAGSDQNINQDIVAGMQCTVLPSHRCGLIYSGKALFMGMPRLPEEVPFPTAISQDADSGASIRMYYGSLFGQNQRGIVHDAIWGKVLVPEYSMKIALPL